MRLCNRRYKRQLNYLRRKCAWGTYVFDCRYHPCRIVKTYGADVDVVSLVDGSQNGCSLLHCIVDSISKELAEESAAYFKQYGFYAFMQMYHHMTDEEEAHWRQMDDEQCRMR